jgi:TPR repeat protein
MKRLIACCLLMFGVGAACADELSDAAKALNNKDYTQTLAAYSRLAQAGNPEAALRLGEMYWYGEGVALDRAKGDALFAQAAAGGSKAAVAATGLTGQRAQQLPAITYWTAGYDGADLTAGAFHCVAPAQPKFSDTKRSIAAVTASNDAYIACYNGFIDNLLNAMPPGKRIPVDIAILMSERELDQARQHISKVYAAVAAREKRMADQVIAKRAAWVDATLARLTTEMIREQRYIHGTSLYARERADNYYANFRSGGSPNRETTTPVVH